MYIVRQGYVLGVKNSPGQYIINMFSFLDKLDTINNGTNGILRWSNYKQYDYFHSEAAMESHSIQQFKN